MVRFGDGKIYLNAVCIRALGGQEYAALRPEPAQPRRASRGTGDTQKRTQKNDLSL
ncbi:MAG: hypothetical protein K2P22_10930 [Lachnospiraceae bacterium]|nr:hypothetical protein [Lachnospiraceae bacterium]